VIAPRPSAASASASAGGGEPASAEAAPTGRITALMLAARNGNADATYALLIAGATKGTKTTQSGYDVALLGGRKRAEGHRTGRCGVQADGGGLCEAERQRRGVRRRHQAVARRRSRV
jgi:hypothetical protein